MSLEEKPIRNVLQSQGCTNPYRKADARIHLLVLLQLLFTFPFIVRRRLFFLGHKT